MSSIKISLFLEMTPITGPKLKNKNLELDAILHLCFTSLLLVNLMFNIPPFPK